ncbi:MAG: DUF1761 domain-containing protein [Gemmatimonadales bacterium]
MPEVNYLAVLVAAIAAFILGWIWYSPMLFAKPWSAENPTMMERHRTNPAPMGRLLAVAFVSGLLAAYAMGVLLIPQQHHSLAIGLKRGFASGVCLVATAFGASYSFEGRSMRHWLINAGYYVVQFTLMGAILGLMNN